MPLFFCPLFSFFFFFSSATKWKNCAIVPRVHWALNTMTTNCDPMRRSHADHACYPSTPWQLTVIQWGVHMLITRVILMMIDVVMHRQIQNPVFFCVQCYYVKYCLRNCFVTGFPSSRLEKKLNASRVVWLGVKLRGELHVIRNSTGNKVWSIYNDTYFEIWTFFS